MYSDQTAAKGSSLIWVHSVCNIGYLGTKANEKAEDQSRALTKISKIGVKMLSPRKVCSFTILLFLDF